MGLTKKAKKILDKTRKNLSLVGQFHGRCRCARGMKGGLQDAQRKFLEAVCRATTIS